MENKVIWFGRYLGCKSVNMFDNGSIDHKSVKIVNQFLLPFFKYRKLILKELKDISDEDAIECIKLGSSIYLKAEITNRYNDGFGFTFQYGSSNRRRNYAYRISYVSNQLMNSNQIDFLRSHGYTVGIPKEFYILEDELSGK